MRTENEAGLERTASGLLPDGWQVTSLGDVAKVVMGQSPPGSTYNETGEGMPFLQGKAEFGSVSPKHVKYTTKPLKIAPNGSVLISVRAPVGDVNIAGANYCIGRGLASLSLFEGDNTFLFFLLRNRKSEIEKEGVGSTFKAIGKSRLSDFKLVLPPVPEQKKIAAVISAVQEAKEKTEAVIRATKELKKSLMKHLFTYGPVPVGEAEKVPLKETEIGLMPEEWQVAAFGDKGSFQYGYTTSATEKDTGTRFLRITDIREDGVIDWSTVPYGVVDDQNLRKFKLHEGDIFFARIGATTGKTTIIRTTPPETVFASYLIRFLPHEELLPQFVFYYTLTEPYKRRVNATRGDKLKKGLSASALRSFELPQPPMAEQETIIRVLTSVDRRIEAEESKKKALDELFKTLLNNLMTAKIRVNDLELDV